MSSIAWRAWVDTDEGLQTFDSGKHRWEDLPDDGILFVMVYHTDDGGRVTRRQVNGDDYFFLQRREGRADLIGSNREDPKITKTRYPGAIVKRGKWTDDLTFRRVTNQANHARSP